MYCTAFLLLSWQISLVDLVLLQTPQVVAGPSHAGDDNGLMVTTRELKQVHAGVGALLASLVHLVNEILNQNRFKRNKMPCLDLDLHMDLGQSAQRSFTTLLFRCNTSCPCLVYLCIEKQIRHPQHGAQWKYMILVFDTMVTRPTDVQVTCKWVPK